jgi:tetratricopeptide (TPR) repeat protein
VNKFLELIGLKKIDDKAKLHNKAVKLHEKGHKLIKKGKIEKGFALYQQALAIAINIDVLELKAHALCNMAQIIANNGDFKTAFAYMDESIKILEELKAPDLEEVITIYEDIKFMKTQDEFEYILNSPELQETIKGMIKKPNTENNNKS